MAKVKPVSMSDLQCWLNKAVEWGRTTTLESQQDVCLHLPKLWEFLLQIYETVKHMSPSTAIERFPIIGQLFGRLCWNPFVVGHEDTRKALISCLCCLHTHEPQNAIELRASNWVQNLLCHLFTSSEPGNHEENKSIDRFGCITADYYGKLLKNIVSSWITQLKSTASDVNHKTTLSADQVCSMSVRCIPVLLLPDVAPLLEALLTYHGSEPREVLDDHFLDSVNDAILRKKIVLSDSAVLSLWLRHLPSLEKAVLDLFQRLIAIQSKSLREIEEIIKDSFLPQAACHPSIFMIVDNIFRNAILESDGNIKVMTVIRSFTHRFIQVYQKDNLQARFPLRAYFPYCDRALVMAFLRQLLGLPQDVCLQHLLSIIRMLRTVDNEKRSHGRVFETWFLLIHFGDWVDIAAEQLLTSGSEISHDLLWLLAFYYNPCNENQERGNSMVDGKAVYNHLIMLHSSKTISASAIRNIFEEGNKKKYHPCTLQLIRHLIVTVLLFSPEWHVVSKELIAYMTQTQEAASEISDVLARTVCRLSKPGMKNQNVIKIAHGLLQDF